MNKKMVGLTLALATIAGVGATSARAERIEVTFSGTLNRSYENCTAGCAHPGEYTETAIAPLSFTRTMVFEIGKDAGMNNASVIGFDSTDVVGRPIWTDMASQTMGFTYRQTAPAAALAPEELYEWARFDRPAGSVTLVQEATRQRRIDSYPGETGTERRQQSWGLNQFQTWADATGAEFSEQLGFFGWQPFNVTPDNIGESFTTGQYMDLLRRSPGCVGCENAVYMGLGSNTQGGRSVEYWGTVTAMSVRDLSAAVVPEPSTYALMLAGVAVLGFAARRRKSA
ncbi:PEP-CTERM sorting domain-containing protein [Roseateles chitinivorans]|uniref:PEP-CTERM sorting domain-containing protein n=1 Tax=Roseateles chitinivorans TaxID=2917965 RepID=UPI003D678917